LGQIALMLGGSLVVALLVCEVATRLFSDIQPPLRTRDREIGNRYRRNFATELHVPESDRIVAVRFNREGFRGPDREPTKPPDTCRVAVIGDSHIAAIATSEEHTVVARLEALLDRADVLPRWELFNFGVSGGSTAQEMVVYEKIASRYDPDVVVLFFFEGNDLTDNSHELSTSPRIYMELGDDGELRERPVSARINPFSTWLGRHSRFYAWQKHAFRKLKHNLREGTTVLGPPRSRYAFSTEGRPEVERAWLLTEQLILKFRDVVERDGRRFLLVTIPTGDRLFPDLWSDKLGRFEQMDPGEPTRRLQAIVERGGVETIFLDEPFAHHIAGRPSDAEDAWVHYNAAGHINERGSEIAARAVRDRMSTTGLESWCSLAGRPLAGSN
jgi:hypothetical protein